MTRPEQPNPAWERVFMPHVGETRTVDPGFLEASHVFRVELTVDEDVLFVMENVTAVHKDVASMIACMKLQAMIRPGHFITHFRVAYRDDAPAAAPIPRQEEQR